MVKNVARLSMIFLFSFFLYVILPFSIFRAIGYILGADL